MAITAQEIERVKYHLGYPSVALGAGIGLGQPMLFQALFPVEGTLRNVIPEAEEQIRTVLARCDSTDAAILGGQVRMQAARVADIALRLDELPRLRDEYKFWVRRLSECTGAPINPTSWVASGGCNVSRG